HRKAEEALALILESVLEGIITIGDQGQTFEYNQAARNIFGYSREEVIGHDLTGLIMPERFRASHDAAFREYLQTCTCHGTVRCSRQPDDGNLERNFCLKLPSPPL
ncbi:MAG: PAS domain-containing protein, partial [Rhodospirillaceae bacterium]